MNNQRIHQSRVSCITGIFFFLFITILGYLFHIQIQQHQFFIEKGKRQYYLTVTQYPPRGTFFDRKNRPLTINQETVSLFINPKLLAYREQLTPFLQKQFPDAYKRLTEKPTTPFLFIKRHISKEELAIAQEQDLKDLHMLPEHKRWYLEPSLGNTLGITNIDNTGITGLEFVYNQDLAGTPSIYALQKDARSKAYYFTKEPLEEGSCGKDIPLTIDKDLQACAYQCLKDHVQKWKAIEGMVLIMNPADGGIYASAMYPDSNPNNPQSEHDITHLKNRCFTECYELGSVMKTFTALAALESKTIQPEDQINCFNTKETTINGIRVTTWKAGGTLSFTDVIRQSNNIGTSQVALKMGKKLHTYLRSYGFGQKTGIAYPGEATGSITPPKNWSNATPLSLSFGYEISVSALQLASAFCMIANNGISTTPRLIQEEPIHTKHIADETAVKTLREIITINKSTSPYHAARIDGYTIQGKTGSAHLLTNGHYDEMRNIYTFAGIVEQGTYQRVLVIIIKEPKKEAGKNLYAATVAAPLFKKIAEEMLVIEKIPPNYTAVQS